ncbi:hypothetical protein PMY35_07245 [Clostridium tertium]|jgi:hypothetical protein|uniref:hypothetical protein n=1 Tax=Clostridium tertium TaxID=1559 RepID=UPI000DCF69E7|nr:hypothetical protein [Clostridium tertium]MDU8967481.1 hypothetical protein [Clostridium sp.]DAO81854.1 MAG TPA: TRIBUTYRIN ESTERASE, ALPHA/BETA HYDROLASE, HYDROLASE, A [Caudoviricetes sp.]MDB1940942.1 hypothetical protein [Clostridium tertium]MDB1947614.1 hypothetical protein [Clostridium tertium]DAY56940.1 MAG TPA: TRIBUTYRIN ESTERASE, ALPHA/BETA HYDROLASE, HYDROLASE, A [Caudoviricetes sp.]
MTTNELFKRKVHKEDMGNTKLIKGKFVNNNSENLVIVFQAAGVLSKEDFECIVDGKMSKEELNLKHQKYSWYKFSETDYADYFFIEDQFSSSYGWYMIDSGKSIIQEFNKELEKLIIEKGYKSVTAFGSSKGGVGALLYGLINPKIDRVFSLVPQIHPVNYIDKYLEKYKSLFFPQQDIEIEKYFNNIFFNEDLYKEGNHINTKVYLYTGIGDEQYKPVLEFNQFLSEKIGSKSNIIINTSLKKHNPIVIENVPFVRSALKLIATDSEMKGPRLSNIRDNILLLRDK